MKHRFIRAMTATFVAVTVTATAACSSAASGSNSPDRGSGTSNAQPSSKSSVPDTSTGAASDATLKVVSTYEPKSMDPPVSRATPEFTVLAAIYARLLTANPETLVIEPGLAKKWYFDKSGLKFTLELRAGLEFSDGTKLDADAVKASLERYIKLAVRNDLEPVTDIKVDSATSLSLILSEPYTILPAVLTDRAGMIVQAEAAAKAGETFSDQPVGAGPYVLKNWSHGTSMILTRNPHYTSPDGHVSEWSEIDLNFNTEIASAIASLRSGQADLLYPLPGEQVDAFTGSDIKTYIGPSIQSVRLKLNRNVKPLDDQRVRTAINLAINRQAIANVGLGSTVYKALGEKSVIASGLLPQTSWNDPLAYKYDPDEAKSLLADAGLKNGFELGVCYDNNPGRRKLVEVLTEQLAEVGIKVAAKTSPTSSCQDDWYKKKTVPSWLTLWTGRTDPVMSYEQNFAADGSSNIGPKLPGKVDSLIAKLETQVMSPDEKGTVLDQLEHTLFDEAPDVALFFDGSLVAYQPGVVKSVGAYLIPSQFNFELVRPAH